MKAKAAVEVGGDREAHTDTKKYKRRNGDINLESLDLQAEMWQIRIATSKVEG